MIYVCCYREFIEKGTFVKEILSKKQKYTLDDVNVGFVLSIQEKVFNGLRTLDQNLVPNEIGSMAYVKAFIIFNELLCTL